jgi:competence protein ComEC
MPLIAHAVLAYAAGLTAGFSGWIAGSCLAAVIVLALAGVRRDARRASLALVGLAGVCVAATSASSARTCERRVAADTHWVVELDDPAAPGAYVRGRMAGECGTPVSLSVAAGVAHAGDRVRVIGEITPGGGGVLIRHAALTRAGRGGVFQRLRAACAANIDAIFGADAPLARALLVADARAIPRDLITRFAAAGIVHALSISGLHVGIIAMAIQLLLQIARVGPRGALAGATVVTAFYVVLIGAPAAAVRSGAMLGVMAASRLAQRPTSPWASLALGALVPLLQPRTVLDRGYQLSVLGIAGLIAGGAVVRRVVAPRLEGHARRLAAELTRSVITTLVTTPLVAWAFGRVSLVAPLTNLVAAPLFGIAQPMLFLALVLSPVPALARFVAQAAHPLLRGIEMVAATAAAVPHASLIVAPSLAGAILAAIAAGALIAACVSRYPARACIIGALALAVAAWEPRVPLLGAGGMELHMIDVGQGDALALRTPLGRWILFDAGRAWSGGDAGRATVIPYVRRYGGDVLAVVLSHPHADHVGGMATVLRALHPAEYWDAAFAAPNDIYRASLDAALETGVRWRRVHPGDSLAADGVKVTFLAPDSAWTVSLKDPNNASTVALIEYGDVRFLLTGDAEDGEEGWLLAHTAAALHADVLKVAHHGSSTSTTPAFLDAVHPRVALVSVGAGNTYGHPSASIMQELGEHGVVVLRTDQLGSVIVWTDGHALRVEATSESWMVPGG